MKLNIDSSHQLSQKLNPFSFGKSPLVVKVRSLAVVQQFSASVLKNIHKDVQLYFILQGKTVNLNT